jgi:hypothetical protein
MYIVLIVKIWNVLDVNGLGDYICVCLTRVAPTELESRQRLLFYTGRRRRIVISLYTIYRHRIMRIEKKGVY